MPTMDALPLFSQIDTPDRRVTDGAHRKSVGLTETEENNRVFIRQMREEAHRLVKRCGRVSIDGLRFYAEARGLKPHSPNAWGAIFHEKGWRVIGHVLSTFPSNRSREIREWTYDGN
ncbi:MAG: hypothetical protein WA045_16660 [Nitrospira sp.]